MRNRHAGMFFAIIAIMFIALGTLTVLYFKTDLLKSNRQLFWKYAFKNVELVKMLSNENSSAQEQWKNTHSYTSEGDLNIAITKTTGTQRINSKTTSKHNQFTDRTYSDVTLYNGKNELLKASYIHNDNIYAIQCKEIYEPYYIGIRNDNLKEFTRKMEFPSEVLNYVPNTFSFDITKKESKISQKEKKYLLDTYSKVIINSISKEKHIKTEKVNITIDSKKYETNGYQLSLNQEEIKQIMINVLTKAKNDTKTIVILNKLLYSESQTEIVNAQGMLNELLGKLQTQNWKNTTFDILVYHVGQEITKTQININNEFVISIDINNSQVNKKHATVAIEGIGDKNTQLSMQVNFEKQTINGMINYISNIINNQNGYTVKMNTTLGNVVDDKIENSSKITIKDNNATIEASYYKTIQQANKEVEIQKLTDTNAVIVNNYPKEQLDTFFSKLGKITEKVLVDKMGQLNIQLPETKDSFYIVQGIVSSLITVANTNGVPQPLTTTVALINQMGRNDSFVENNVASELEEQEKATFNSKFTGYEGTQNGTVVKNLINNVINSNTLYFNENNKKIEIKIVGSEITKPKGWTEIGESDVTKLSTLRDNLDIKNEYNISIEKNASGYIHIITITSK